MNDSPLRRLGHALARPVTDLLGGLELCLADGLPALARVAIGLALGWWLYVPVHELLHAAACVAAGGSVSRLEIDALYGGKLLARCIPWVVGSSDYAGRLSGFDPHGSDFVRIATDLGPFLLTLLPGVWGLRAAARRRRAVVFGMSLAPALAPFLSLSGDAYEIGALLTTRLPPWSSAATSMLLRGDDFGLRFAAVGAAAQPPWGGLGLAATIGLLWAMGTYGLGSWCARRLGQPPITAVRT